MDCWNCEKNIDRQASFEVITKDGIVQVCRECLEKENFPVLNKKKTEFSPPNIYSQKRYEERKKENPLLKKEEELKKIANKNYSVQNAKKDENLINNFHWIIMRIRRSKKLTQKQFANEIKIPEAAIKIIEKGLLPKNHKEIIKKIENYLGINLSKKREPKPFEQEVQETKEELVKNIDSGKIKFDEDITKKLTLKDLKEMKKKDEGEIFGKKEIKEEPEFSEEDFRDKKDLTDEEMNDIIFGRE